MKILLIGINAKYIHPAVGIYQIHANSKYPTCIMEFTIKDEANSIVKNIMDSGSHVIGISVYIWNINKVKEIISLLSEKFLIILGGPEAGYRADDFIRYGCVKYIIAGEGEESFNELCDCLVRNRPVANVSNLYYRKGNGFIFTFPKTPDINLIEHDLSLIGDYKNRYAYIESSRGCCFRCTYCLASLDRNIRYFPLEKVKENIKYLLMKNIRIIKFLDRSFSINDNRMQNILKFIIDNDNGYTCFQFEINGEYLSRETVSLLRTIRKGLIRFEIGIQSTNTLTLKEIRRPQDFTLIRRNIEKIKHNIIIHADLIAGLPFEDFESFKDTFNKTYSLDVEEIQLGFLKELKGTEISAQKQKHGYVFDKNPPYQIIRNHYIGEQELTLLSGVESVLNKYHNTGNFKRTVHYLFSEKKLNPFAAYFKIYKYLKGININSYQHWQVAKILYLALRDDDHDRLLYLIKQDYLTKDRLKPKIWWPGAIDKKEKALIFQKFILVYPNLNNNILYRYGRLEKCGNEYFLVVYKPFNYFYLTV